MAGASASAAGEARSHPAPAPVRGEVAPICAARASPRCAGPGCGWGRLLLGGVSSRVASEGLPGIETMRGLSRGWRGAAPARPEVATWWCQGGSECGSCPGLGRQSHAGPDKVGSASRGCSLAAFGGCCWTSPQASGIPLGRGFQESPKSFLSACVNIPGLGCRGLATEPRNAESWKGPQGSSRPIP